MATSQPNLRDCGQSAPVSAMMIRQNTAAPGAAAASFSSSAALSKANSRIPRS